MYQPYALNFSENQPIMHMIIQFYQPIGVGNPRSGQIKSYVLKNQTIAKHRESIFYNMVNIFPSYFDLFPNRTRVILILNPSIDAVSLMYPGCGVSQYVSKIEFPKNMRISFRI